MPSNLAASSPGEQHEGDDHEEDNQHPVLRFEAKKTELLNEKLHSVAPFLCKMRPLAEKIYYFDTTEESASIFGEQVRPYVANARAVVPLVRKLSRG